MKKTLTNLMKMAQTKNIAIAKDNGRDWQYSFNGYEWTVVKGTFGQFFDLIKGMKSNA